MRLAINVDHIATLREARKDVEPDPVTAAHICELAGAEGIVCHLREDRRHINDRDLKILRDTIKTKLDLEMAASEEILKIAIETLPDLSTLVPEKRQELTTEGGLNVKDNLSYLTDYIKELHKHDINVSIFIDPVEEQIEASARAGADYIEIHTGEYANSRTEEHVRKNLQKIEKAAKFAKSLNLKINAGHGINYLNIAPLIKIKEIEEMSIGFAVIARAAFIGLDRAVRDMINIIHKHSD
jgi:pyridoxine 5-phosphate synthase